MVYFKRTLPNGLRIFYFPKKSKLSLVGFGVQTGSIADPPGKEGLSHLVEHLIFNAYDPVHQIKLDEITRGYINGQTSLTRTDFFIESSQLDLSENLGILLYAYLHFNPDQSDLKISKKIVIEELKLRNEPDKILDDIFRKKILGIPHETEKSLKSITLEDVVNHYTTYYQPQNTIFLIFGGFEVISLDKNLRKRLQDLPRGGEIPPLSRYYPKIDLPYISIHRVVTHNLSIKMFYPFRTNNIDDVFLDYLVIIIEQRLYTGLRVEHGWVYTINVAIEKYPSNYYLIISFAIDRKNFPAALRLIKKTIISLQRAVVSARELTAIRHHLLYQHNKRDNKQHSLVNLFIQYISLVSRHIAISHEDNPRYVPSAEPEKIKIFMEESLDPEKFILLIYGDVENPEKIVSR